MHGLLILISCKSFLSKGARPVFFLNVSSNLMQTPGSHCGVDSCSLFGEVSCVDSSMSFYFFQ